MSNRTPKEALREIRNRIVYMYGNIDGTFSPPALKEVCEIADDAISSPITEKSSAVGNAAAMREALREAIGETCAGCSRDCDDCINLKSGWMKKAKAALAAPARNCDVGTAEEQKERFDAFCNAQPRKRNGCDCDLQKNRQGLCEGLCEFAWAQTPYEAEEGNNG